MSRVTQTALLALFTVAAGLVGVGAGCGSDSKQVTAPPPRAQPAASSSAGSSGTSASMSTGASASAKAAAASGLEGFRGGLVQGQQQIDSTLTSLSALADPNQQDLRGAYNAYCDNLARMNEHADSMKREADGMRSARDEYFGKWEAKAQEIDNPTIRASAEARRKRLRDAHEAIASTSGDARDAYTPFMKDLQDIKKFLAGDLSKGSIADIADAVKKVQGDGTVVKQKVQAVIDTLDKVQGGAA